MGTADAPPQYITSEAQVRREYRSHRYLQDVSDDALFQVGRDVWRNFHTINSSGKLSPLSLDHRNHFYWRDRLLQFLEEMEIRFGPYDAGMEGFRKGLVVPNPKSKKVQAALTAVDYRKLIDGTFLVKYGKHSRISAMLTGGEIRLVPASEYAKDSHIKAIRDHELQLTHQVHNPSAAVLGKCGVIGHPDVNEGTLYFEGYVERDYYIFCLSASYDPCLFDDFHADSCLLIREPREFRDRLLRAADAGIPNRGRGYNFGPVTYVDPFTEPDPNLHYCMRKHHRFTYQDEVRAAWEVSPSSNQLAHQTIRLGHLGDIVEEIHLEEL